jgi:hypothetical protein
MVGDGCKVNDNAKRDAKKQCHGYQKNESQGTRCTPHVVATKRTLFLNKKTNAYHIKEKMDRLGHLPFPLPREILVYHIIGPVARDALYVCRTWHWFAMQCLLEDDRICAMLERKNMLMRFCANGNLFMIQQWRDHHGSLVKGNPSPWPLVTAASHGHKRIVMLLLEETRYKEQCAEPFGALYYACRGQHFETAEILLRYCHHVRFDRLLILFIMLGHREAVLFLLQKDTRRYPRPPSYNEAMMMAASHDNSEMVRYLLAFRARTLPIPENIIQKAAMYHRTETLRQLRLYIMRVPPPRDLNSSLKKVGHPSSLP